MAENSAGRWGALGGMALLGDSGAASVGSASRLGDGHRSEPVLGDHVICAVLVIEGGRVTLCACGDGKLAGGWVCSPGIGSRPGHSGEGVTIVKAVLSMSWLPDAGRCKKAYVNNCIEADHGPVIKPTRHAADGKG